MKHAVLIEEGERLVKEKIREIERLEAGGDMSRARLLRARKDDMEASIAWMMNDQLKEGDISQ